MNIFIGPWPAGKEKLVRRKAIVIDGIIWGAIHLHVSVQRRKSATRQTTSYYWFARIDTGDPIRDGKEIVRVHITGGRSDNARALMLHTLREKAKELIDRGLLLKPKEEIKYIPLLPQRRIRKNACMAF